MDSATIKEVIDALKTSVPRTMEVNYALYLVREEGRNLSEAGRMAGCDVRSVRRAMRDEERANGFTRPV